MASKSNSLKKKLRRERTAGIEWIGSSRSRTTEGSSRRQSLMEGWNYGGCTFAQRIPIPLNWTRRPRIECSRAFPHGIMKAVEIVEKGWSISSLNIFWEECRRSEWSSRQLCTSTHIASKFWHLFDSTSSNARLWNRWDSTITKGTSEAPIEPLPPWETLQVW